MAQPCGPVSQAVQGISLRSSIAEHIAPQAVQHRLAQVSLCGPVSQAVQDRFNLFAFPRAFLPSVSGPREGCIQAQRSHLHCCIGPYMAVAVEDQLARRTIKRWNAYIGVRRSEDYINAYAFFGPSLMPDAPNPFAGDTLSKRAWEKRMENWRHELKALNVAVRCSLLETGAFD